MTALGPTLERWYDDPRLSDDLAVYVDELTDEQRLRFVAGLLEAARSHPTTVTVEWQEDEVHPVTGTTFLQHKQESGLAVASVFPSHYRPMAVLFSAARSTAFQLPIGRIHRVHLEPPLALLAGSISQRGLS